MPKRTVTLGPGDPKKAVLEWEAGWGSLRLMIGGAQYGEAIGKAELMTGHEWPLPDRSKLFVRLRSGLAGGGLEVKRTGTAKSHSGATRTLSYAFQIVLAVALLNIVLGSLSVMIQTGLAKSGKNFTPKLVENGFGMSSIVVGAIYLFVAIFVRHGSAIAIGLGLGIVGLELVCGYLLLEVLRTEGYQDVAFAPFPLMLKILVIGSLLLALLSVKKIREKPKMYVGRL